MFVCPAVACAEMSGSKSTAPGCPPALEADGPLEIGAQLFLASKMDCDKPGVAYAAGCCDGLACCGNCPLC